MCYDVHITAKIHLVTQIITLLFSKFDLKGAFINDSTHRRGKGGDHLCVGQVHKAQGIEHDRG